MNQYAIPKATLGRLPQYLEYLRSLPPGEGETISAAAIARGLSLGDVQVRKDLAAVSGAGRPKVGYETKALIHTLEERLGYAHLTHAVLVGAGKLGRALLEYDGFARFGVKIVAAFDCNSRLLTEGERERPILPMAALPSYCLAGHVKLGIITVGQGSAQEVCDRLVESGITAIWNFAPCTLQVPPTVCLKQEDLALSLAYLNDQIRK